MSGKDTPELEKLLADAARALKVRKLYRYQPYPWQKEFHDAGASNRERMLMAANRVGKTESAAAEVAYHLTGEYPEWWQGKRFDEPVLVWIGSVTNEASRDICQKTLLGGTGEDLGTGYIPKHLIIGKPQTRQAGISDVVDLVKVRHKSGGVSSAVFKTYDQGWRKSQGTAPHVVWMDEEPSSGSVPNKDDYRIFTEAETRILTSKGVLFVTFTPLNGETDLVRHFVYPSARGIWMKTATWEDAPHLSEEDKEQLRASYPSYEVDARTKGVPTLGEGRVFTVSEDEIKCAPFEIPRHFAQIIGIDFGIDHPAAAVRMAWERDGDKLYLVEGYRIANKTADYHGLRLKKMSQDWIPIAWPHDGMNRDKGGGAILKDQYFREGATTMLSMSARYENDKGGPQPQEPVITEILERMNTGRFFVFSTLTEWFEEFRSYHRKDGKLIAVRDDMLKASFYAVMMRRFAQVHAVRQAPRQVSAPLSMRVA